MDIDQAISFTRALVHQVAPQEVLWQVKEACRALLAEVERLREALKVDQCPRCHIDGYWHRACRLKEAEVERLRKAIDAIRLHGIDAPAAANYPDDV